MELNLKDKVAIITGPAKGMGFDITRKFAEEGCRLVLIGRDIAAINGAADEIRSLGFEAVTAKCDITEAAECENAVEIAKKAFGGQIDILVNIAGGSGPIGKTGAETTADEFDDIISLNVGGCFHTIRAVASTMIEQKSGKIINVGGTFGMRGRAGRMAYSSSKWGLRGVTKSFALELGPHNINVNYVAPGMVDGPRFREKVCANMAKQLGISIEEAAERHADDYALKRITQAADVANACLFFASDVSRQVTGADLAVDGGWAST